MYQHLFAIIAPVFLCAGLGYFWAKKDRPYDVAFVTDIATNFGTPCLVFSTLAGLQVSSAAFFEMTGITAIALGCFALIGIIVLRLANLPNHSYLPALVFPNSGNMGLALCLFAFGEPGLALGIAYFTVASVFQFTVGNWLASGSWSPKLLFQTPLLYAVAAGVLVMTFGVEVPRWLDNTTKLIGGLTIPFMLITLGVSLARLKLGSLPRSTLLAVLRIGMGVAVGFALAELFELEGATRGVMIIDCAMPVAVFNYLFAQRYKREPEEVAGMVVISTAISFVTLPFLLLAVL